MEEQEVVTPRTPTQVMLDETGMKEGDSPGTYVPVDESPTIDKPEETTQPEGSEETQKAPQPDDTDWQKRHGDAVRWAQQNKAKAEGLEQELQQLRNEKQRYADAGLDYAEIDKFIEGGNSGTPSGGNRMDTSNEPRPQAQPQGDVVTKSELNSIMTRYNYDMAKRDFADANPDFRDRDYQDLLDVESHKLAAGEFQQYGSVTSPVDEIVREAGKKVTARINKFVEKGKKAATEKRQSITDAAITEGDTNKKPSMDADETSSYSRESYAKSLRSHRDKIKRRPTTT